MKSQDHYIAEFTGARTSDSVNKELSNWSVIVFWLISLTREFCSWHLPHDHSSYCKVTSCYLTLESMVLNQDRPNVLRCIYTDEASVMGYSRSYPRCLCLLKESPFLAICTIVTHSYIKISLSSTASVIFFPASS